MNDGADVVDGPAADVPPGRMSDIEARTMATVPLRIGTPLRWLSSRAARHGLPFQAGRSPEPAPCAAKVVPSPERVGHTMATLIPPTRVTWYLTFVAHSRLFLVAAQLTRKYSPGRRFSEG